VARTRAQRRRQNILLLVALAVTLLVLLFARDVNRAAHASSGVRRSENRSFAQLANALLESEHLFGQHLGYLLTHGATLSRPVFAARLDQLALQLPDWSTDANLLRRPDIDHDLNTAIDQLTVQRVDDYQVVLDSVAAALDLPWTTLNTTGLTSVAARSSLLATDREWGTLRHLLGHEPGHVDLAATVTPSSVVTLPTTLDALAGAASLKLTRGVGIAAVAVTPSPFPAPAGRILLPPVTTFHLGVAVTNAAFVRQPVTLTVTLTALTGATLAPQTQAMSVTLGPLRSYAFVPRLLTTLPGEHAVLTVTVRGAPSAPSMSRRRTYLVILSPAVAARATFSVQPGDTSTGVATHARVTVLDGLGTPVEGDAVTITLASGPGNATASSTLTATTNFEGVAAFTKLVFDTPGTYSLTATDGLAVVTSNSFTVASAGAASANVDAQTVSAAARASTASSVARHQVTDSMSLAALAVGRAPAGPRPRRSTPGVRAPTRWW